VHNRRQFQVNTEPAAVGNTFANPFRGCTLPPVRYLLKLAAVIHMRIEPLQKKSETIRNFLRILYDFFSGLPEEADTFSD
jgi:hypothetical protein